MIQHDTKEGGAAPRKSRSELAGLGPVVVAISAAASSIDSLERFFRNFLPNADAATVLIFQHRESLNEERLQLALESHAELPRVDVRSDTRLEGGKVYVCGPNLIVTVEAGELRTRAAEEHAGARGTIDSFLVSLADAHGERAIAVVMDGTAGDGTLGVAAIKQRGGLAIAEARGETSHADLAATNAPGALADFLLAPEEMPSSIAVHVALLSDELRDHLDAESAAIARELPNVAAVLRNRTGHDFHGYKQGTFVRRVQRRMQVTQKGEVGTYVEFLRSSAEETQDLFNDLLIGVTQFFRDPAEFEVLESQVIPRLFEGKTAKDQIRVWVLGCASGEEAYSLAILLREHTAKIVDALPQIQIFATDIDSRGLAAARVGRYPESIATQMSPERLARWFIREGNTYCIVKELRETCIFSAHNVIRDAPFSRMDLISCRNLLIYLNTDLQTQVIPLFHFALRPNSYLFLGNAENVTRHPKLFQPIDRRSRIFRRQEADARVPLNFPIAAAPTRRLQEVQSHRQRVHEGTLARRAERIAERHAPAYVVTDEHFEVLHFSGRTGRFIEPLGGAASLELLSLVHRDLRLDLRAALLKAVETNEVVAVDGIVIDAGDNPSSVDIVIEPSRDREEGPRSFVVIFKDATTHADPAAQGARRAQPDIDHAQQLEQQLRSTRERLQSTIEELESTNEELKSSNEEYQSLNEELQSTNEELETSKEELQSVNEELITVNGELAHRVHDLTRATSDLKNFLESTQIATLFLDNDFRVMNFTPAVTEIFHLVDSDVGRPITHIKSRIPFEDLQSDIRKVMRTLGIVERTMDNTLTHTRYIMRVLPYRSVDNFIAGTVLTFVDVTQLARAEESQKLLLAELQHRVRNTLGVVRSIARRTAESSETVKDFASHLDGRLDAFARLQSAVTRDPGGGIDLEGLIADELRVHAAHEGNQVQISGPAVRLQAKAAETFALAVHELGTNAVKYGALATPRGRVAVSWNVARNDRRQPLLHFTWSETGAPDIEAEPRHRGFGTELLERTLGYELKAVTALQFGATGMRCQIAIPLTERFAVLPLGEG